MNDRPVVIHDFEGRSACNLKTHGSWIYSKHPSTEVLCMSYNLPWEGDRVRRWHMAHPQHLIAESPPPLELFKAIEDGCLFEAHNAMFEWVIWRHIMVPRYGWPEIPSENYRCSAARASAASLPRDLEGAIKAMNLPIEKDMEGRKLMLKLCKPRKPRKAEREAWAEEHGDEPMPILWNEEEHDLVRNWAYCDRDVLAEKGLSASIPHLSDDELEVWLMDQVMNRRGVEFDLDLARSALAVFAKYKTQLNGELEDITGIKRGSQRQQVKDWLAVHKNIDLPDTKGDTIDWILTHDTVDPISRHVMTILRDVNRTSTRKYQSMLNHADEDWRVRDLLMYHGAGTGRWAGKGVQVHNFPARNLIVKDFDDAAEVIKSENLAWCRAMYGDVMKLLSHALRGAIIPEDGNDLMVADYAAIEARVVLWLAGATSALKVFLQGKDIYCDMATGIYGYEVVKGTHNTERQFGKQAILGLGFGMGFITFLITCRKYDIIFTPEQVEGIMGMGEMGRLENWVRDHLNLDRSKVLTTDEKRLAGRNRRRLLEARLDPWNVAHELALMKYTVDIYRDRYADVKQLWKDQEAAAIHAVRTGSRTACGKVTWFLSGGFLCCELPSGRLMRYRDPIVKEKRTSWGEFRPHLSYMSVNGVTRRWERTGTYGGKIVENITQAVARDIMKEAMVAAHREGKYLTCMSVHDELVSEIPKNEGSVREFEELLSTVPSWAHGCPIAAEGERLTRYKK